MLTGKIGQANEAVNKFEGTLGKAQGAAMSLAGAVGIAFGTAAVVAFGSKMIQAGSQVENALTGLTTLAGTLTAGASSGTNGQLLTSTGTGVQWSTVSGYNAPTIGSTLISSGATVSTITGLTENNLTLPVS